jgi:hypothetical protein
MNKIKLFLTVLLSIPFISLADQVEKGKVTFSNDVTVAGALSVNTLAITNGAANGAVWVATNTAGKGELKVYGKMKLKNSGKAFPKDTRVFAIFNTTPVESLGNSLTSSTNGIAIGRSGYYLVGGQLNLNSVVAGGNLLSLSKNVTIFVQSDYLTAVSSPNDDTTLFRSSVVQASAGDVIRMSSWVVNTTTATNPADSSYLYVVELP